MTFKNQVLHGLTSILLSTNIYASNMGVPCSGVPGAFYTNPDSSLGGFVASSAQISKHPNIGLDSVVYQEIQINSFKVTDSDGDDVRDDVDIY